MKKLLVFLFISVHALAQEKNSQLPESLIAEGLPPISSSLADETKSFTEFRGASLTSWIRMNHAMLVSTRVGNTNQLHLVTNPLTTPEQLTFYNEPINNATVDPKSRFFIFSKDTGGNEFGQLYRYDFSTKQTTLLTDGKRTQNGNVLFNPSGDVLAYSSTKRNSKDRDFYLMNPMDTTSHRLLSQNEGGGWSIVAWSPNEKGLLVNENLSVNESRLYVVNVSTGEKRKILPSENERATFHGLGFSAVGAKIYLLTNKDFDFTRLASYDLATEKITYFTSSISWDVEDAVLSSDRLKIAFTVNQNGYSVLYLFDTTTEKYKAIETPKGIISGLHWLRNESIGFSFSNYQTPGDVYEYKLKENKAIRWTQSDTGALDVATLRKPELLSWKTFDGKTLYGFRYAASATGKKRPVIINIHGGPESQSRPTFIGRNYYFTNVLGADIIYPNVRGSSGYGKTFLDLDNGVKREESVQDIGDLLDWVAQQPDLDASKIMITGGSYGGYMTLAVSTHYADKIACSLDVVGISNFNTFLKNTESYRKDLRRVEYGDERDPAMVEFFEKISPLNHTDKIKKPIFIVQGFNDPRVPYTESVQMKDKIKQGGGTVWFLMGKDEGHGFRKKNNVDYQFYATIEFIQKFLLQR